MPQLGLVTLLERSSRRGQAGSEDQAFLGLNIMRVQPASRSFALCVEDGGREDLEARKVYQILPTVKLHVRVTSESSTTPAKTTCTRPTCSFQ